MASLYFLLCVTTILLSSAWCNNGESTVPHHKKALFVFGDSLFDPGNNPHHTGGTTGTLNWPYGETFPGYPTGRYSDGRVPPDFIAEFAGLGILDPYLSPNASKRLTDGANFASGGASVLGDEDPRWMNLGTQLSRFKEAVNTLKKQHGEKQAMRILNSAVYLFSFGGNDYFSYSNENATEQAQYVKTVISGLTHALKEIYSLGGRKIAFQNAMCLGCAPLKRVTTNDGSCAEMPLIMARRHNRALPIAFKKLQSELPGFKYSIYDFYNTLLDRIDHPHKYEFKEGKAACCGSGPYQADQGSCGKGDFETCSKPSKYVWWDSGHLTEATNRQSAELIWSGPQHVTGPYTVKELFELP